jgi:sialidase-1
LPCSCPTPPAHAESVWNLNAPLTGLRESYQTPVSITGAAFELETSLTLHQLAANGRGIYRTRAVIGSLETITFRPHRNTLALHSLKLSGSFQVPEPGLTLHRTVIPVLNGGKPKPLLEITLQVSLDDGKSWPARHHLLLDSPGRIYSSLVMIDDHTLGILYESSQADLVFQKIPLSDLL